MKIATAPVNWNNADVPHYRPWIPYPQLLDEMVSAGYSATEWGMNMPRDDKQLLPDLQASGLEMLGGFVGLELRNPERRKQEVHRGLEMAQLFKRLGGAFLIVADSGDKARQAEAGRVNAANALSASQWRNLTQGLQELAQSALSQQIQIVLHNHVGTYIETEEEMTHLLETTDPALVSWCLDCGHLAYAGGDTLKMIDQFGDRIGYVHLKDVDGAVLERARSQRWSFAQALESYIFAPLGEGIARVPDVVRALHQRGYNGWLVVEQDTTPGDPTEVARGNRRYLETLLAEIG